MINTNFAYMRPESIYELNEALSLSRGAFMIYGGGSEIISMARAGSIAPECVIDIKRVPEARKLTRENGTLTMGAALTLAEVAERADFPLLKNTVSRVADHTNQCRITLGGNIAGTIAYREAVLPLLLADARCVMLSGGNIERVKLMDVFDKRFMRAQADVILNFELDEKYTELKWAHEKRTRGDKIDYPVVTIASIKTREGLRFALSGVLAYPFRDKALEEIFSDGSLSAEARAEQIIKRLPQAPISDTLAGADWRAFQTKRALEAAICRLEGYDNAGI